jgi:hypothetical protein
VGSITIAAGGLTVVVAITQLGLTVVPTLSLSVASGRVGVGSGSVSTTPTTNQASWSVVSRSEWLSVSRASGSSGQSLSVTAAANATGVERTGTVVLRAGTAEATFTVSQDEHGDARTSATVWSIPVTATSASVSGVLGSGPDYDYFKVVAPWPGTYTFASSMSGAGDVFGYLFNSSGTQLASNDDGGGNLNFSISYALTAGQTYYVAIRNFSSVTTSWPGYQITATVPVGFAASASGTIPGAGGSVTTTITTNLGEWALQSAPEWVSASPVSGVSGTVLTLSAGQNPLTSARSGSINLRAGSWVLGFGVSQAAGPQTLSLSPASGRLAAAGGSATTTVTTNQASWSVSSRTSWLAVDRTSGASGAVLTVSAAANATGAERSGSVVLRAGSVTATFAVTQDEHGDSIAAATGWSFAASARTASIGGRLGVGADWDYFRVVAPSSGVYSFQSAMSVAGDLYGYLLDASGAQLAYNDDGGGSLNFLLSYSLTAGQTYYVAVRNYSSGTTALPTYTVTVTLPATLSLSMGSGRIGATGGSITVAPATNQASWSVVSTPPWLTAGRASGSSGQSLTLTAGANGTGVELSGMVLLRAGTAEVTLRVSQDEHGDARTSATVWPISASAASSVSGLLGVGSDYDYFKVIAPATGTYTFRSAMSTAGDLFGHLYNSSGTQLTSNDDGGGSLNFLISYALTAGQTYYIAVRNYSSAYPTPVAYTITSSR